ncbi:MAG: SCO family protein [Pseudomonadota bacterium]|nr:SCO family protein [Pseudomonadota bacterium]
MTKKGSLALLVAAAGIALAGLVSISMASFKKDDIELPVYDHLGGDFSLQSTNENFNSMSAAEGKVVLLSFGFTSCPDICPMMLEKYRRAYRALDRLTINGEKASEQVVMYFVTVDPKRDSLDKMVSYFKSFDTRIIGLRGTDKEIDAVQASVAVASQNIPNTNQISHSDRIMLFDTQGRLRAMPTLREPLRDLVSQVEVLLKQEG